MKISIRSLFRKRQEDFVAGKLGIIVICEGCHKKIHLEDENLHRNKLGMLDEEDGYLVWIHDKTGKSQCYPWHYKYEIFNSKNSRKTYHLAYPMRVDA